MSTENSVRQLQESIATLPECVAALESNEGGTGMTPELARLIEAARYYEMSDAEKREQRISFVYGNLHIENPNVTREMVRRAAQEGEK